MHLFQSSPSTTTADQANENQGNLMVVQHLYSVLP
jgi:hypothetical protein